MPRKRNPENLNLPKRWKFRHGAYFYHVPLGHEPLWGNKQTYRLGATLEEAFTTFYSVAGQTFPSDAEIPQVPNLSEVRRGRLCVPKEGVYFLFRGDELVYIGRSECILARLSGHSVQFDSFFCIEASGFAQERLEQLCIAKFRPPENGYVGGRSPANGTPIGVMGQSVGNTKTAQPLSD